MTWESTVWLEIEEDCRFGFGYGEFEVVFLSFLREDVKKVVSVIVL